MTLQPDAKMPCSALTTNHHCFKQLCTYSDNTDLETLLKNNEELSQLNQALEAYFHCSISNFYYFHNPRNLKVRLISSLAVPSCLPSLKKSDEKNNCSSNIIIHTSPCEATEQLIVSYALTQTLFGLTLIAATKLGTCLIAYCTNEQQAIDTLKQRFPSASFEKIKFEQPSFETPNIEKVNQTATSNLDRETHLQSALAALTSLYTISSSQTSSLTTLASDKGSPLAGHQSVKANTNKQKSTLAFHLIGTDFQIKVWRALLTIPMGGLTTYSMLAKSINKPSAIRALASAVGKNPIAVLLPCHRVIRKSGEIGGYHWGIIRKKLMLSTESAINKINAK